ncbi:chaperonin 10-like protein [Protomyces lactucae-debilis]|uniref:Chaperonin 10-like protein n=1 Tax=Protomyces lactucae-debilis TaxID=2754530 RepID=A0A1Y2FAB3_PROLT|nr:chaperonin 10-like protein [Protomyces lactucae-debilis]ORY80859.1 chaperonin 10-like protein [Protomyces lactucae-debilis]
MTTGPACILRAIKSHYQLTHDYPHPIASADEVLIHIEAIGLNPIDWKSNAYGFGVYSFPWINGREAAGTVLAIGTNVGTNRVAVGDRVLVASSNYRDCRSSSFQERCVALPENIARIPDYMSFEEAATLGVGLIAGAAALFDNFKLPFTKPSQTPQETLLIWGGASTAGLVALQLAKQAGLRVLTVSSTKNFSYLIQYGADLTLDRHTPEQVVEVAHRYGVRYAIDCVGAETTAFAARAVAPLGGTVVGLVKLPSQENLPAGVTAETILIKRFHEDRVYGDTLMRLTEELLKQGKLRAPRIRLVSGGLAGIPQGLQLLQDNQISGEKVVVKVSETPRPAQASSHVGSASGTTAVARSRPGTPKVEHVQRQSLTV